MTVVAEPRIELSVVTRVSLDEYARVPIAFQVSQVLDVVDQGGAGGWELVERSLEVPYVKDYDTSGGTGPVRWAECFDILAYMVAT
jgi:hypothetical protein